MLSSVLMLRLNARLRQYLSRAASALMCVAAGAAEQETGAPSLKRIERRAATGLDRSGPFHRQQGTRAFFLQPEQRATTLGAKVTGGKG